MENTEETNQRIVAISTPKLESLSSNLKAVINMTKIKQDYEKTFVDINTIYPFIKDDAMLLIEFQALLNSKEKRR